MMSFYTHWNEIDPDTHIDPDTQDRIIISPIISPISMGWIIHKVPIKSPKFETFYLHPDLKWSLKKYVHIFAHEAIACVENYIKNKTKTVKITEVALENLVSAL